MQIDPSLTSLPAMIGIVLCCLAATWLPRIVPLYFFSRDLPDWLKDWLNYVPAAVLAALVAPDLFFYGGSFNPDPFSNLFLLAGIAAVLFCVVTKNFFATIIFAMVFVAGMRHFGLGV